MKDKLTLEFIEYLYNFFLENKANICEYCKHNIKCGKDCDCYEEYGNTAIDESGKEHTFLGQFTCQDVNFGECKKLENTPCNKCFESNTKNFEWNGNIPQDLESY